MREVSGSRGMDGFALLFTAGSAAEANSSEGKRASGGTWSCCEAMRRCALVA